MLWRRLYHAAGRPETPLEAAASVTTAEDQHHSVGINRFDRDILTYMLLWDPHGDLEDEDLFPMFGMNVEQFRQRFAELVASYDQLVLHPADRDLVECARRYRPRCTESRTGGRLCPNE